MWLRMAFSHGVLGETAIRWAQQENARGTGTQTLGSSPQWQYPEASNSSAYFPLPFPRAEHEGSFRTAQHLLHRKNLKGERGSFTEKSRV